MAIADLVRGCPLFHELYDDEVEDIIQHCFVVSYEPGDVIVEQGDTGTDICVILEGHADVSVSTPEGPRNLAELHKGDLFGELVLINETQRTATVKAREHTEVLVISYEDFYSFYSKKPAIFALMVLNVTRLVTKRLKRANMVIEGLSHELSEAQKKAA